MKHTHILVIRFSALGDVAMTIPVVYTVARQYPDVRITVLSRPFARPLFENLAPNVSFMGADVKNEYSGIKGLNALYRRIVAKQITHVADLHAVLRSGYLRLRFNLGRFHVEHIDKHRSERRQLVARQGKQLRPLPTPFDNYADVFARLGFPVGPLTFTSIFPDGAPSLATLPPQIGQKADGQHWIGIAPLAAHEGKVYPPELSAKVIGLLANRYPQARFFLFGRGPQEDRLFKQWAARWPQCVVTSWHLDTLHQELALMSHLDVMLSMDSANMHLASLVGVPVVSVWGATHPLAGFMGYGQRQDNAVQLPLPCRPCSIFGERPCLFADYHCLSGIEPQAVAGRIISNLQSITRNVT